MQLTNILRDVREDCERGRVYLPAEDSRASAAATSPPPARRESRELIRFEAARGREWFERGLGLRRRCSTRAAPRACWR